MPAFCRAMSGGSASRNPTPAYDGATPRHTGIRNRFPPAANAPSGKTGNSETKSGKDFLTRAATDVNSDLPHRKIQ